MSMKEIVPSYPYRLPTNIYVDISFGLCLCYCVNKLRLYFQKLFLFVVCSFCFIYFVHQHLECIHIYILNTVCLRGVGACVFMCGEAWRAILYYLHTHHTFGVCIVCLLQQASLK